MTLFTLYCIPDGRYGVRTLHVESGCLGGMGYFPTPERARFVLTSAYKTPLMEVDDAAYREAVKRSQQAREAVRIG